MNYEESQKIRKEVDKAEKILVNCHRTPDPDSIGCALSLYQVLKGMGKEVEIICPDEVSDEFGFLPHVEKINKVDYSNFDYKDYDLFIALDSSSWLMVTRDRGVEVFDMPIVVIDHHKNNDRYGKINLVDDEVSSCAEVLYQVFEDWGVEIDKDIATTLLVGILGDTGVFKYPSVTPRTMDIARALMEKGADKDEIIYNIFSSVDFELLKFWGEVLKRMEKENGFVWSAVPYGVFKKLGEPLVGKETAASLFGQVVKDTDFGLIMVEQRKGVLAISFRARGEVDVSALAETLGGGGHKAAAGAKVEGMEFEDAVKHVLKEAKSFAESN